MTPADLAMVRAIVAKLWRTALCYGLPRHHQDEAVSRTLLAIVEAGKVDHLSTFAYVVARKQIVSMRDDEMRHSRIPRQLATTLGVAIAAHEDVGFVADERGAPGTSYTVAEVRRAIESAPTMRAAAAVLGVSRVRIYQLVRELQISGLPRRRRSRLPPLPPTSV